MRFHVGVPLFFLYWVSAMGTGESFVPHTNSLLNPSLSSGGALLASNSEGQESTLAKVYPAKGDLTLEQYKLRHKESIENPEKFWGKEAKEHLDWFRPFDRVKDGSFLDGDIRWFTGGQLNLCYNALDRYVVSKGDQPAIVWEGDEPSDIRKLTYKEVFQKVCQISNALLKMGVQKGSIVTIYMP